jgi:hypothetical protein
MPATLARPSRLRAFEPDISLPLLSSALGSAFISHVGHDDARTTATEFTIHHVAIDGIRASYGAASALVGRRVLVDMPLTGRREAEVRWQKDDVVGCRFVPAPPASDEPVDLASTTEPEIEDQERAVLERPVELRLAVIEDEQRRAAALWIPVVTFFLGVVTCLFAMAILDRLFDWRL